MLYQNAKGPGLSSIHPIFGLWRSFFQQCTVVIVSIKMFWAFLHIPYYLSKSGQLQPIISWHKMHSIELRFITQIMNICGKFLDLSQAKSLKKYQPFILNLSILSFQKIFFVLILGFFYNTPHLGVFSNCKNPKMSRNWNFLKTWNL